MHLRLSFCLYYHAFVGIFGKFVVSNAFYTSTFYPSAERIFYLCDGAENLRVNFRFFKYSVAGSIEGAVFEYEAFAIAQGLLASDVATHKSQIL